MKKTFYTFIVSFFICFISCEQEKYFTETISDNEIENFIYSSSYIEYEKACKEMTNEMISFFKKCNTEDIEEALVAYDLYLYDPTEYGELFENTIKQLLGANFDPICLLIEKAERNKNYFFEDHNFFEVNVSQKHLLSEYAKKEIFSDQINVEDNLIPLTKTSRETEKEQKCYDQYSSDVLTVMGAYCATTNINAAVCVLSGGTTAIVNAVLQVGTTLACYWALLKAEVDYKNCLK